MRDERIERAERRRVHLERSGAIDEAVAGVRRELDAVAGAHAVPEWDDLTSAAVRNLLGLVQRHGAGDLVLLVPDSGYAVRIRHDGAAPTAGVVVVVPEPRRPAPEESVAEPTAQAHPHDLLGADPPPASGAPAEPPPLRSLQPDLREELEERRRAARERLAHRAGPVPDGVTGAGTSPAR